MAYMENEPKKLASTYADFFGDQNEHDFDGTIAADAARALSKGGSLLPVGIIKISGFFERGDAVHIVSPKGKDMAMGLANYGSKDLGVIFGKQSNDIEKLLGYTFGDEVIHHNNMLLL